MNRKFLAFKLWFIFIGLMLGNILYQQLTKQDYVVAFERSWFQGWALLDVWLWFTFFDPVLEKIFDK